MNELEEGELACTRAELRASMEQSSRLGRKREGEDLKWKNTDVSSGRD